MAAEPVPEQSPEQVMDAALDAVHTALQADARSWAAQVRSTTRLVEAARIAGGADRSFVELEIAGSWAVGQATATRLMVEAEQLTTCLPATLAALEDGRLLVHQARVLLHVTRACSPLIARQVETEVLAQLAAADGAGWCPADLRAAALRVLLRLESEADPDAAAQRHADAAAQRRTWAKADDDGMGVAGAVLTAEQLSTWTAGLDALEAQERVSDRQAGIDRTADQRRADLFAALPALVLAARAGDPTAASSMAVRPQVVLHVHVPMATVLDLSCEPGHLDGYGPISAQHVRLLRPVAYRRVLVDADTGRPLTSDDRLTPLPGSAPDAALLDKPTDDPSGPGQDCTQDRWQVLQQQLREALVPTVVVDRAEAQHDPSARLARLVDVRDRRCSGPGCSATRTHRDHAEPWPAGPTAAWNLQRLSARCHRAKHSGWRLDRHGDGSVTWHSPLGRTYSRPSPHPRPPQVDLHTDPPPRRPPPTASRPVTDEDTAQPPRRAPRPEPPWPAALPDEPPF